MKAFNELFPPRALSGVRSLHGYLSIMVFMMPWSFTIPCLSLGRAVIVTTAPHSALLLGPWLQLLQT